MAQYGTAPGLDRQPLQIYSSGRTDEETSNNSPSSGTTTSPTSPFPNSQHGVVKSEGDEEQSPGPEKSDPVNTKSGKEKRKRSRVTPEQLVHLESYFEMDRSPTAARRKDISEILGMQERQTQIWFQNRRAKAKLLGGKHGRESMEIPPDTPPQLSSAFESDLQNLIHEDEPVTIIPCTDLTIGTWRRVTTSPRKHDLVAYVSEVKRCLTWFIHSGGYGFKMEIPYETIVNTEFRNASPGIGQAIFALSRPPIFYLESVSFAQCSGVMTKSWKRCSDWTEDHQATRILFHTILGSAVQLAHVLRNLHFEKEALRTVQSRPTSYRSVSDSLVPSPVEIQPPPLAGLVRTPFAYDELSNIYRASQMDKGPERLSYSSLQRSGPNFDGNGPKPTLHNSNASTASSTPILPHHAHIPNNKMAGANLNRRASYQIEHNPLQDSQEVGIIAPYPTMSRNYYAKYSRNSGDFTQFEGNTVTTTVSKLLGPNSPSPSSFFPPQYHASSGTSETCNFSRPLPSPMSHGMSDVMFDNEGNMFGKHLN